MSASPRLDCALRPIADSSSGSRRAAVGARSRWADEALRRFTALDDVSLTLAPGIVPRAARRERRRQEHARQVHHGLLPAPTAGASWSTAPRRPIEQPARRRTDLGIGMVYQHFTLVANMTVAENLVLSRARAAVLIDWSTRARASSRAFMERMPFRLDPRAPVRTLAAGEKQKLEILKQLYLSSRIVILDEPTSVLTPGEADEVLGLLREMTSDGRAQRADDHAQVPRGDERSPTR